MPGRIVGFCGPSRLQTSCISFGHGRDAVAGRLHRVADWAACLPIYTRSISLSVRSSQDPDTLPVAHWDGRIDQYCDVLEYRVLQRIEKMLEFDANSWHIFRLLIAMEVLISASCVCRCLARWRKRLPLSWDDGWIFLAWALYTTYFALCLASCGFPEDPLFILSFPIRI